MNVSILIPTYNRSWHLRRTIESALAQSYSCEVLVFDDASDDDTGTVVRAIGDDRVRYTRQADRRGMVGNWGDALHAARGDAVVFLADDDLLGPTFVARRVAALTAHPTAVAAFSEWEERTPEGDLVALKEGPRRPTVLVGRDLLLAALSRRWFIGTALYRRDAVIRVWGSIARADLVLDLALNLRLALRDGAGGVWLPGADFTLTRHPGQNSEVRRSEVFAQTEQVLREVLADSTGEAVAAIRRELAAWLTVWGRELASRGDRRLARRKFLQAIRVRPTMSWSWRQLFASAVSGLRHASR